MDVGNFAFSNTANALQAKDYLKYFQGHKSLSCIRGAAKNFSDTFRIVFRIFFLGGGEVGA